MLDKKVIWIFLIMFVLFSTAYAKCQFDVTPEQYYLTKFVPANGTTFLNTSPYGGISTYDPIAFQFNCSYCVTLLLDGDYLYFQLYNDSEMVLSEINIGEFVSPNECLNITPIDTDENNYYNTFECVINLNESGTGIFPQPSNANTVLTVNWTTYTTLRTYEIPLNITRNESIASFPKFEAVSPLYTETPWAGTNVNISIRVWVSTNDLDENSVYARIDNSTWAHSWIQLSNATTSSPALFEGNLLLPSYLKPAFYNVTANATTLFGNNNVSDVVQFEVWEFCKIPGDESFILPTNAHCKNLFWNTGYDFTVPAGMFLNLTNVTLNFTGIQKKARFHGRLIADNFTLTMIDVANTYTDGYIAYINGSGSVVKNSHFSNGREVDMRWGNNVKFDNIQMNNMGYANVYMSNSNNITLNKLKTNDIRVNFPIYASNSKHIIITNSSFNKGYGVALSIYSGFYFTNTEHILITDTNVSGHPMFAYISLSSSRFISNITFRNFKYINGTNHLSSYAPLFIYLHSLSLGMEDVLIEDSDIICNKTISSNPYFTMTDHPNVRNFVMRNVRLHDCEEQTNNKLDFRTKQIEFENVSSIDGNTKVPYPLDFVGNSFEANVSYYYQPTMKDSDGTPILNAIVEAYHEGGKIANATTGANGYAPASDDNLFLTSMWSGASETPYSLKAKIYSNSDVLSWNETGNGTIDNTNYSFDVLLAPFSSSLSLTQGSVAFGQNVDWDGVITGQGWNLCNISTAYDTDRLNAYVQNTSYENISINEESRSISFECRFVGMPNYTIHYETLPPNASGIKNATQDFSRQSHVEVDDDWLYLKGNITIENPTSSVNYGGISYTYAEGGVDSTFTGAVVDATYSLLYNQTSEIFKPIFRVPLQVQVSDVNAGGLGEYAKGITYTTLGFSTDVEKAKFLYTINPEWSNVKVWNCSSFVGNLFDNCELVPSSIVGNSLIWDGHFSTPKYAVSYGTSTPVGGGGGANLPTETICDDGIDNDGDGLTDCEDPDCADDVFCIYGYEEEDEVSAEEEEKTTEQQISEGFADLLSGFSGVAPASITGLTMGGFAVDGGHILIGAGVVVAVALAWYMFSPKERVKRRMSRIRNMRG